MDSRTGPGCPPRGRAEQGVLDHGRLVDAHSHRLADRVVEEQLVVVRASRLVLRIRRPDLRGHDVHIEFGDKPGIRGPLLESGRIVPGRQRIQVVRRPDVPERKSETMLAELVYPLKKTSSGRETWQYCCTPK